MYEIGVAGRQTVRIITNIHARYGRVSKLDATEQNLKFEPGFLYAEIPYISGIQNRKLSRYVHFYLMDKAILQARDLKPLARAFLLWIRWMEDKELDPFTPGMLKYQSPTYGFREYLLWAVKLGRIASSTAAVYISVIRRFYVFLDMCGELTASSFFTLVEKVVDGRHKVISSDLAIRITTTTKRTINPLNDKEVHILDEALKSETELFSLMITLMKNCGLRLDEMLTLPSSVFTEEYLTCVPVSQLTIRDLHIGPGCGVHTKFGITRELFITRRLYEQILDYLAGDEYEKKINKWRAHHGGEGRHEPLFLMANGRRMSEKAFYSRWYSFRRRLARSAPENVFRHKPHDLRATFATLFLRSALSCYPDQAANALGTVKYWMGHKSENTTMKYIVFLQQHQISDAVAGVMDAMIDDVSGRDGAIYEPE